MHIDDIAQIQETAHWIAAPMKDVGTFEQFHEVVDRAARALKEAHDNKGQPSRDDNQPWSERYRVVAEDWVEKEAAAALLEDVKSAVLAQSMAQLGDVPVAHAERTVKASDQWEDYVTKTVNARKAANHAKVQLEYIKMKAWKEKDANATRRAEMNI